MFCELLGKAPGYCRGKGGSMHIADQENGNLGANAIVGGSAALATGAAFANKRLGNDRVVVCFFGEGALGQGVLYESMNMAQLWKLPVLYVCENNLYNEYTHHTESTAGSMRARAEAFGILTVEVDGQNVREVHEIAQQMVARARQGEGPAFILCHTYRYHGHHVGDINRAYYRSPDEEKDWKTNRDPLKTLQEWLTANQMADSGIFQQIERDVQTEVARAVEYALNAPYPEPEEVSQHVYV
jgi:pyruvate dehydrogenase E1 component alpha subunit